MSVSSSLWLCLSTPFSVRAVSKADSRPRFAWHRATPFPSGSVLAVERPTGAAGLARRRWFRSTLSHQEHTVLAAQKLAAKGTDMEMAHSVSMPEWTEAISARLVAQAVRSDRMLAKESNQLLGHNPVFAGLQHKRGDRQARLAFAAPHRD